MAAADPVPGGQKLPAVTHDGHMRDHLFLLQDLNFLLFDHHLAVIFLLVGEIRKFEFMADIYSFEFLWNGLVFIGFVPKPLFGVVAGEAASAGDVRGGVGVLRVEVAVDAFQTPVRLHLLNHKSIPILRLK